MKRETVRIGPYTVDLQEGSILTIDEAPDTSPIKVITWDAEGTATEPIVPEGYGA